MENGTQSPSLRTVPPKGSSPTDMTVFTLEQAVEAVKRARDEVRQMVQAKDAAETRVHEIEHELQESEKRVIELQSDLDEAEETSSEVADDVELLRADKALVLEMLGLSEQEWETTRNNFDRAAHIAGMVRTRRSRLVELITRSESVR